MTLLMIAAAVSAVLALTSVVLGTKGLDDVCAMPKGPLH